MSDDKALMPLIMLGFLDSMGWHPGVARGVAGIRLGRPNGDVKPATWNWFALDDPDESRPLFAFAGIWRTHKGPIKKDGPSVTLDVFSFMTTTPNALVATVNHERMPVLLATEAEHEAWLNGRVEDALSLVKPYPAEGMRIVQTGYDKRDRLENVNMG